MDYNKVEDISQFLNDKRKLSQSEIDEIFNNDEELVSDIIAYREVLMRDKHEITYDIKEEYSRLHSRIARQKRFRILKQLSVAASILLVFASSFLVWNMNKKQEKPVISKVEAKKTVESKSKATLTLADGRKVQLVDNKVQISDKNVKGIVNDSIKGLQYDKSIKVDIKSDQLIYNTLKVPVGGEYSLTLADGTRVILNSDSEIKYPIAFGKKNRKVFLKGEAYFAVTHNKKKPFIVDVNEAEIEVLGTEFNISAYEDEKEMYTTLVNGSVRFTTTESNESQILTPNHQIEYNKETKTSTMKEVDVYEFIAWKDGSFVFKSLKLEKILRQLRRWYDFKVVYHDEELKDYRFRGVISRDMNLTEVMKMIEESAGVKIVVKEKEVSIYK